MTLLRKIPFPPLTSIMRLFPAVLMVAMVTLTSFHTATEADPEAGPEKTALSPAALANMLFDGFDGATLEGGAEMPCDYRSVLMSTPGFMTCLNDAWMPGFKYKINWQPGAALCGPFGSWQGYIWLTFDCPPPCLGPPDYLVAEVLFCGNCTLISWSCT